MWTYMSRSCPVIKGRGSYARNKFERVIRTISIAEVRRHDTRSAGQGAAASAVSAKYRLGETVFEG